MEQKSSSYSSTWLNKSSANNGYGNGSVNSNMNSPITGVPRDNRNNNNNNNNALSTFVTKWSNDLLNAAQKILHLIKDTKLKMK